MEWKVAKAFKARLDKKEELVDLEVPEIKETKAMPENLTPPKDPQVPLDRPDPQAPLETLDQLARVQNQAALDLWATPDQKEPPESLVAQVNPVVKDHLELVAAMAHAISALLHDWRLAINGNRHFNRFMCNYNIYDVLQSNFLFNNFMLLRPFLSFFPFSLSLLGSDFY